MGKIQLAKRDRWLHWAGPEEVPRHLWTAQGISLVPHELVAGCVGLELATLRLHHVMLKSASLVQ